jgi:non-specific serine/threonine protein kinase
VREEPGTPLTATITDALRQRSLLLVLDNCEHVIANVSVLANMMLKTCAGLRILATSRQALNVPGETLWQVPSLSLPDLQRAPASAEQLVDFDAVRLFLERATSMQPGLMTPASNQAIVDVCRRLDGIPLAIEFAAARTKVLSVEQIAARLDDRFRLLTGGARTAPPRQRTLQAAMDWSYDLLSTKEQLLLQRLSVFAGGWTLEAAEGVCAGESLQADAVLDMLTQLVDKSLVVFETRNGDPRYRLLESVRQYAQTKLAAFGEASGMRRRHAAWFMTLAERAGPELSGADQVAWQERLELDLDNFRAAMQWSLEDPETDTGVRIAGALHWFWYVRGYFSEGVKWLEAALAGTNPVSDAARARALQAAGSLMLSMRRYDRATALAAESRAAFEEAGDPRGVALACTLLGYVALDQGDYLAARGHLDEALRLSRAQEDMLGIKTALNHLGELERCRGDYGAARRLYEEGLAVARAQGETRGIAGLLANLGFVASHEGDYNGAAALFSEALQICRTLRHRLITVAVLIGLARVAAAVRERERAARLLGAAEVVLGDLGTHLYRADRLEYEEIAAAVRDLFDTADYATFTAEGRAMTIDQAIAYALREAE